ERVITETIKLDLERSGPYDVFTVNESHLAIGAALRFKPHVILLDALMPPTDGADIGASIESDRDLRDTPIVYLAADIAKPQGGRMGSLVGGSPILPKPIFTRDLIDCIEKTVHDAPLHSSVRTRTIEFG